MLLNKIIKLIHENVRLSDEEIARRLDCSKEEVTGLLNAAEEDGRILGYRVITSDQMLPSDHVIGMVEVGLAPERERGFDRIAERIARFPEVVTCILVSGSYDLLVQVRGNSLQDVAGFISERLATIEGVRYTRTHFCLKRYKEDGVLLFQAEQPERLPISP